MGRRIRLNHASKTALALLAVVILASTAAGGVRAEDAEAPAKACVTDVDKVIATKPTGAMTTASLPADLVAKLDEAARLSFREAAAPGAIVGVRTPAGTWTAAYGKADPAAGTPMAVGMHTRIGSVTKTFTGTVIMQLAEAGKLSLDDPIEKYVPRCSERRPDKPPDACRHDERRRQLHPKHQVHRHLLRETRDDLHAGAAPGRRHRRIARSSSPAPASTTRTPTRSCSAW